MVESFDRLKSRLGVDPLRLDEELIRMPAFIQEISERTAEALRARSVLEDNLKTIMAETANQIRASAEKKPPEAQVDSLVLTEPDVQNAIKQLEQAKYEYSLWQGLMDAARTKSTSLKTFAELIISGYLTLDSIHAERRHELNEVRRAKIDRRSQ